MRLTPITPNIYPKKMILNTQPNISFRGNNENNSKRDNFLNTYLACAAAIGLLSTGAMYKCTHDELEASRDRLNKMFDKIELEHDLNFVRRDTLTIDDVTGDNCSELILYKNDGSKVVIDISGAKKLNPKEL